MTKGRPVDPSRAKRQTGNRPKPGEADPKKAKRAVTAAVEAALLPVEDFPPPSTLPVEVHDVWRSIVADLGGSNYMRQSFVPAVSAYCEAVYLHAASSANIHEFGVLVKGPMGGPVPNPLIKVQKDAAATMLRYAETLGLTPAARIRVGLMEVTGMSLLSGLNNILDGK